jgi:galactokinase
MNRREALIARVIAGYRAAFGEEPAALYAAPGRVNLIGEHVDYNDGLVLPCAIDRETIVAIGENPAGLIETAALDMGADARDSFDPAAPIVPGEHEWANHVRGTAHFIRQRGHALRPARMAVAGDVPIGAGLSSSASFGVASALALSGHAGASLPPEALALIAQAAENDFAGCACGIMDQMASAASAAGSALLLDCRTLATRPAPLHPRLAITVIDSGLRRSLVTSAFNQRRAECEAAARHYGVASLRDLTAEALAAGRAGLDEALFLRARHVVAEIARVEPLAAALASGDTAALAQILAEGHRSLAQDFAVSLPALDALAAQVQAMLGDAGGVRLTGAGFGGCLVAVSDAAALSLIDEAVAAYNASAAVPASTMRFAPGPGASRIAL